MMKSGCCADKSCAPETCMELPDQQHCSDCVHMVRCLSLFGGREENTNCGWFPRKFLLPTFNEEK